MRVTVTPEEAEIITMALTAKIRATTEEMVTDQQPLSIFELKTLTITVNLETRFRKITEKT